MASIKLFGCCGMQQRIYGVVLNAMKPGSYFEPLNLFVCVHIYRMWVCVFWMCVGECVLVMSICVLIVDVCMLYVDVCVLRVDVCMSCVSIHVMNVSRILQGVSVQKTRNWVKENLNIQTWCIMSGEDKNDRTMSLLHNCYLFFFFVLQTTCFILKAKP